MAPVSSERLAFGLVFIAIAVLACLAPVQSDTWWLLRAGQDIWRTHRIPIVDPYSSTAQGLFWPNHEWLTEVIFYAAYRLGGLPFLTALCAATIVGTWTLSFRLMRGSFEVRFLLFAGSLAACASGWAIRPQIFSMAAFVVTCVLLLENRLKWLPVMFILWANLHGAVALGLAAIGAVTMAAALKERRAPWALVGMFTACALATCISPLGLKLWTFIPESMARSRANQLIEWLPPNWEPMFWPFWAVGAALMVLLIARWRHLDDRGAQLVAIAVVLLPLAARAQRNVSVFLLVGVPAVSVLLARPESRRTRKATENVRANAAVLAGTAFLAVVFVALTWMRPPERLGWKPISQAAVAAIDGCGTPLYNTYGDGGVLIWFAPKARVFIDNRQDPYPMPFLAANHNLELTGDFEPVFHQYDIRCAAVPPSSPIAAHLRASGTWTEAFSDAQWAVMIRR